mmetsp:Transcript_63395/g.145858  ORF Transcript_63395/g.145858 Transcript_63395/m.145858 type:complete len:541 (-) Transcript_63395:39-1661(-)
MAGSGGWLCVPGRSQSYCFLCGDPCAASDDYCGACGGEVSHPEVVPTDLVEHDPSVSAELRCNRQHRRLNFTRDVNTFAVNTKIHHLSSRISELALAFADRRAADVIARRSAIADMGPDETQVVDPLNTRSCEPATGGSSGSAGLVPYGPRLPRGAGFRLLAGACAYIASREESGTLLYSDLEPACGVSGKQLAKQVRTVSRTLGLKVRSVDRVALVERLFDVVGVRSRRVQVVGICMKLYEIAAALWLTEGRTVVSVVAPVVVLALRLLGVDPELDLVSQDLRAPRAELERGVSELLHGIVGAAAEAGLPWLEDLAFRHFRLSGGSLRDVQEFLPFLLRHFDEIRLCVAARRGHGPAQPPAVHNSPEHQFRAGVALQEWSTLHRVEPPPRFGMAPEMDAWVARVSRLPTLQDADRRQELGVLVARLQAAGGPGTAAATAVLGVPVALAHGAVPAIEDVPRGPAEKPEMTLVAPEGKPQVISRLAARGVTVTVRRQQRSKAQGRVKEVLKRSRVATKATATPQSQLAPNPNVSALLQLVD